MGLAKAIGEPASSTRQNLERFVLKSRAGPSPHVEYTASLQIGPSVERHGARSLYGS
jgi:hypothetical protein